MTIGRNYAKFKDAGYSFEEIARIFASTPIVVSKHYRKYKRTIATDTTIEQAHFQPFKSIYGPKGYEAIHLRLSSMDFGDLIKLERGEL